MLTAFLRLASPTRLARTALVGGTALALAYTPMAAQAKELDVPYVPTPPEVVARMLDMAQVASSDYVIDLGSGDGRIAIAAVRDRSAKGALGVDIDPARIAEAEANAKQAGVSDKVQFRNQDLFDTDLSRASVITMYLLPDVNMLLRPRLLDMPPGTRVVSHAFDMDDWDGDEVAHMGQRVVYLWIVPAKVGGSWRLEHQGQGSAAGPWTVDFQQSFQRLAGTARAADGSTLPVQGRLRGADISFTIGEGEKARRYTGRVDGQAMKPVPGDGTVQGWRAARR